MLYKIALITLLSLTTTISARSLEGYKCRDQTILSDDPLTPLRTVRICGVMDYPTAQTNYYQTVANIGEKVHPSSPTSNYFNRRYSSSGAWPIGHDQGFQRTFSPTFPHWPAQPVQTESDGIENLLLNFIKSMQSSNEPGAYPAAATNYPSNTASALNADKLLEVQRFNEQSVNTIAEDATEIKSSVTDVVAQMKNMLGTLLLSKANKAEASDININVNLKLDPSFQSLLQDFLELAKTDMVDSNKNVETDESAEDVTVDVTATQDNSEEHVTQEQTDSEESSNESVDKEDSEVKSSSEDFDTWFRIHFGPAVKLHHTEEDTDNDNSEAANSSETTEESFESWFNAVYRKYATVEEKDYETSEESTTNTQASEEIVQSEYVDSSNENNSHNEHDEWKIIEDEQKSAEVNSEDNNDDNDDNNDYATFFVPTTMDPTQQDASAEFLLSYNKYLYNTENNFNSAEISDDVKLYCALEAKSFDSYITCLKRSVEQQDERKNFVSVEIGDDSDSVESKESVETLSKSSESNENEEIDSAASDSQESADTESATTDSSESKESGETEGATTDSSESKESGETEGATTDSSESKESGETEGATTDSSESKESGETEGDTTDSSESKESAETEEATAGSSESKESAETEGATTGSSESKESAETEGATTDSDWYDYSDDRIVWINEK